MNFRTESRLYNNIIKNAASVEHVVRVPGEWEWRDVRMDDTSESLVMRVSHFRGEDGGFVFTGWLYFSPVEEGRTLGTLFSDGKYHTLSGLMQAVVATLAEKVDSDHIDRYEAEEALKWFSGC